MKKITIAAASAALMLFASCQKSPVQNIKGNGFLSFGEFALEIDETLITKADAAGDNYSIRIYDDDENVVASKTYAEIKDNNDMLSLPAGNYTLVASSLAGDVPTASWENPIYGISKPFSPSV